MRCSADASRLIYADAKVAVFEIVESQYIVKVCLINYKKYKRVEPRIRRVRREE